MMGRQYAKVYPPATAEWALIKNGPWFKSDGLYSYTKQEGGPGMYGYDGQRLVYHPFPIKNKPGEDNYYSITTPYIRRGDGSIWVGTYGAAIGYDGERFTVLGNEALGLTDASGFLHIRSLMEDSKGNLWIGNNGMGVIKYSGGEASFFTKEVKLRKEEAEGNHLDRVFSMAEDASGNIWFGTADSGVWQYDGDTMTNYSVEDGMDAAHVWTIYQSKNGGMWFGTANPSGVYKYNGEGFERVF
ncbi:two-component regulator propeller domain-containing protein [Roseivirga sp. BDSF3-8]|uniref:ligand-binding sensor domain-containing protein n=1 Tax=Roseivirga sp. BDSF3-8 TaxID=3241598 RepID=UPI003531D5A2